MPFLIGFLFLAPQIVNAGVYVYPEIIFRLSDYDTYVQFQSLSYADFFYITNTDLGFYDLSGYVSCSLRPTNVNLTIIQAGDLYIKFQVNGTTSALYVVAPYYDAPVSVEGALYTYNPSTHTISLTTYLDPSIVIIRWTGSTSVSESQMRLILFVLGFAFFFGSLGLIAHLRTKLKFLHFLYLVIALLIGFGLMVGAV